jgi:hypothetical protein
MATYVENVDYGIPEGATMGRNSTEKISFYGTTPVVLNTTSTGIVVTTIGAAIPTQTAVSNSPYGASTAAIATSTIAQVRALMVDMAALQAAINIIRKNLVDLGLLIGS